MTVRIGVIGAGAIARYAFLPGFSPPGSNLAARALDDGNHDGCPGAQVVMLSSPNAEKVALLAGEFNVPRWSTNWLDVVNAADIDAVCIATPNYLHHEMTLAACRAGKHVLVEKPLALNIAQASEMVQAARTSNVVLMVHQNQRFFPVHEVARRLIAHNVIGPILSLRARWSHAGPEHWSPAGAWFFDRKRAGGGALFDLGIHKFDLIRYLTGKEAVAVAAFTGTLAKEIDVEDNGVAILRFADGTFGVVEASWSSEPLENSIRLYGTSGVIQIGTDSRYPISIMFQSKPDGLSELPPGEWDGNTFIPYVPGKSETGGMFRHFVDCIINGKVPIASGEDNVKSLEVCLAAFESAEKSQVIQLPLVRTFEAH